MSSNATTSKGLAGTGYRSAICLVRGQENPALSGYWQVKDAKVRYNMVYDCKYGLNVNYASSSSNQVMPVISTVIEGQHRFGHLVGLRRGLRDGARRSRNRVEREQNSTDASAAFRSPR